MDHFLGIDTRIRVDGRSVDVEVVLGKDLGTFVYGFTGSVENSSKHVFGHSQFHAATRKFDMGGIDVDAGRAFKDLDDCLAT